MRRQTNTINFSTELPLAQGIRFGDDAGSASRLGLACSREPAPQTSARPRAI